MNAQATAIERPVRRAIRVGMMLTALFISQTAWGEVPKLSVDSAAGLVGEEALLEMRVASVKFAERRQTHFLSSTPNFRGRRNLPVAIRDDDLERFREAGISDLAARYKDQRIRARGNVVRDEGQVLLVVSGPEQIELLDAAPTVPKRVAEQSAFAVIDPDGQITMFKLPLPKSLPRRTLRVDHEGTETTYSGVALATILERAGVALGKEARGRQLARYVVVAAADDYTVVFSIAEVDPYLTDQTILLAETMDGRLIDSHDGLLLAVSGDKRQRRWVRRISRIEVRSAVEPAATAKSAR